MNKNYINIVVGGGHAGIECALSISRMGGSVLMVTNSINSIGRMSCNPAIGGLAKSHLVYEIDAMGGIMGEAADVSAIQYKTLNKSKGRAVWSSRAQVDKRVYSAYVKSKILNDRNIEVLEDEAIDLCVENSSVVGVYTKFSDLLRCTNLIITTGTFLNGKIHIGNDKYKAGRIGEPPSTSMSKSLLKLGFKLSRLKTGTPPRLLTSSIDWSLCDIAPGDKEPYYFSDRDNHCKSKLNIPCYVVNTSIATHKILKNNLNHSAMFSGQIDGIGPRYCPSIEDKIVRFATRDSHQLFLEPEWMGSNQIYLNGFSTSMPKDVQIKALKSIPAFKNVELIRPGYAIEYDYIPSSQLKSTLETKLVSGLYFAGQVNGTSGYEEAAAQGLIAGINAQLSYKRLNPFILLRSQAYIGVLVDDLITKTINEPYRMFTSRAEHRLHLRPDNASIRLTQLAHQIGLVGIDQYNKAKHLIKSKKVVLSYLKNNKFDTATKKPNDLYNCILRGDVDINDPQLNLLSIKGVDRRTLFVVETYIKYKGYVDIEKKRVILLEKMESVSIPKNINYKSMNNLSAEAREKLSVVLPETLGQASRIDGVRASDISILSVYIKHALRVSRET